MRKKKAKETIATPAAGAWKAAVCGVIACAGLLSMEASAQITSLEQILTAHNEVSYDSRRNVIVDIDGDTAVIAVPERNQSVYVYHRSDDGWNLTQTLTIGQFDVENLKFGRSVSLDGDTMMIGGTFNGYASGLWNTYFEEHPGCVYVFTRTEGVWSYQERLTQVSLIGIDDFGQGDAFGKSISLDGDTAMITGSSNDYLMNFKHGDIFVFERTEDGWQGTQTLTEPLTTQSLRHGLQVCVDGDSALVFGGYSSAYYGFYETELGAAFFKRINGIWQLETKFIDENMNNSSSSISLDGDTAMIGGGRAGVYVFNRSGGIWNLEQMLNDETAPEGLMNGFGRSVRLDGNNAIISGWYGERYRQSYNGHLIDTIEYVSILTRSNGIWSEQQKFDGYTAGFGRSLAIDGDSMILSGDFDANNVSAHIYSFNQSPASIPGTIEAEGFDQGENGVAYFDASAGNSGGVYRDTDVDLGILPGGDNYYVSWIDAGEWLRYTPIVEKSGIYLVTARVASGSMNDKTFHLEVNGQDVTGSVTFNTGGAGWQAWQDVAFTVSLEAGLHEVDLVMDTGGFSVDYLHFELRPSISVPGRVEAENFDEGDNGFAYYDTTAGNSGGVYRDTDVDLGIYTNPDYPNGEGHYVSWINTGEWLRYTLNAEVAGSYFVVARVATGSTQDKTFHVEVDGVDATGPVTFNTGGAGWQAWQDVIFSVSLEAGVHEVYLEMDTGGFSIDFLHFVAPK